MIQLGGGVPVEIGSVNKVEHYHLEGHLTDDVAAVVFVVSHHTAQSGMLSLESVIAAAHERGVPVIIDAAAESSLSKFVELGADLVIYSGHKAFGGPTSGIVVGRSDLVAACAQQNKGIGRTMKIGKESIVGLITALQLYAEAGAPLELQQRLEHIAADIGDRPGVRLEVQIEESRAIPRLRITLNPAQAGLTAAQLVGELEAGDPIIKTRNHLVEHNVVQVDPRPLREEEDAVVAARIREILQKYAQQTA